VGDKSNSYPPVYYIGDSNPFVVQKLQGEREELLRKLRDLERKLVECKGEAEQWEGEAHELKKALSTAQTQAGAHADSLQVFSNPASSATTSRTLFKGSTVYPPISGPLIRGRSF
jgi:uncharacterized Zn finger protein